MKKKGEKEIKKKNFKKSPLKKVKNKEALNNIINEEIIIDCGDTEECKESTGLSVDVLGIIVDIAAGDIPGISGMSAGIVDGIAEKLGKKDLRKGIKVGFDGKEVVIDLYVIVEYGYNIIEVCNNLREAVRETVEQTTNLKVSGITVHVQGVSLPGLKEEE